MRCFCSPVVVVDPVVLGLEAAHLRAELEERERRRVVDPDRKLPRCDAACVSLLQSLRREHPGAHACRRRPAPRSRACGWRAARAASRARRRRRRSPAPPSARSGRSRALELLGLATLTAMFRTKLVLPMPGRAATIVRSPSWRPRGHAVVAVEAGRDAGDARRRARSPWSAALKVALHDVAQLLDAASTRGVRAMS